jgi:hypothetical protein
MDATAAQPAKSQPYRPSEDYPEILEGLRRAARSQSLYGAAHRARELPPVERAAIGGFCETVWQIVVNDEAFKLALHPYIDNRLKERAAFKLGPGESSEALEAAMGRLIEAVGLRRIDAKLDRGYKKACYRGASGTAAAERRAFRRVLVGLRRAARSNTTYTGLKHTDRLAPIQKTVLQAFCDTAWQLVVNKESALLAEAGFIASRISGRARALNDYTYDGIPPAMKELDAVIDFGSYDAEQNRRYKKACGR